MGKTCGHTFHIHSIMFESSFFFGFVFCSAKFKIFSDSKSFKYIRYYKYIAFSAIFFSSNKEANHSELWFSNFLISGPLHTLTENSKELFFFF